MSKKKRIILMMAILLFAFLFVAISIVIHPKKKSHVKEKEEVSESECIEDTEQEIPFEKINYGVFIGMSGETDEELAEELETLKQYDRVVVEPESFSHEQIEALHQTGTEVYAYLNVGSVENSRYYYGSFEGSLLDVYNGWEEERWIDVSDESWQAYLVDVLAKSIVEEGFDGFFIDNLDVYWQYPTEEIYGGLCNILTGCKAYGLPMIGNGGDTFVQKAISEEKIKDYLDGVNQEGVFTKTDVTTGETSVANDSDQSYYLKYLKKCQKSGLETYIIEYHVTDEDLQKEIDQTCNRIGINYYLADSLELN